MTYSVDIKASNQIDYTVQSASDYYPYGKSLRSYGRERYLSTYHERDVESGFDYRGARFYDSDVARFNSLDPLAADFASWSPYNYVMGNPLSLVDSDGRNPDPPGWFARATQAVTEVAANATAYVAGMANSIASNAVGGAPGTRGNPNDFGNYAGAAAAGQTAGDVISVGVGVIEMVGGAIIGVGGTIGSLGTATAVAAPAGVAVGAHGALNAGSGLRNLMAQSNQPNSATKNRVKLRKSTTEKIKENAPKTTDGDYIDPNTGKVISKDGPYDIGHKPGNEWRTRKKMHEQKGSTRKEVIEAENDPNLYQIEDPSSNRSHKYEKDN